jgi:hypothetical protein
MSGAIHVHIDELVLIGVRPGDRDAVVSALQAELTRLLRGTPPAAGRGEPVRLAQVAAPGARLPARADARSVGRLAAAQVAAGLRRAAW